MTEVTDQRLLRDYARSRSDAAFAELVRRHVDLVYSVAMRIVHDTHLAEDVTQAVFLALAKQAPQLTDHPVLCGWLHRTTLNLAANTIRSDTRRRAREQEAVAMNELLAAGSNVPWEHIAPHLDAALAELGEPDRDAVLLRYFERKSAREMAQILGVSDEAAQKRVSRAVDRLREFIAKRGVGIGASGLVVAMSANAVQAAPAGLALSISTSAAFAGATVATTAASTATKAIAMTTLQKTIIGATLAAAVGTGIYEAHQAAQNKDRLRLLQQQQAPVAGQIDQLQRERDDLANRLALLAGENASLKSNSAELLRLRSEVTALRKDNLALARNRASEPKPDETQPLGKGFGTLGEFLPSENISDVGNGSAEAFLQTFIWAVREGKLDRLEQVASGAFGGQSQPGDVVGKMSESEAAIFKTMQSAFTNSAGFRLSSKAISNGQKHQVRIEAEPLPDRPNADFVKGFHMSFVLQQREGAWSFGDPADAPKAK